MPFWDAAALDKIRHFLSGHALEWGAGILKAVLVIVAARLALKLGALFIDRLLAERQASLARHYIDERRARTMGALLKSLIRYAVNLVALLALLGIFGFKDVIAPLLAGAGVAGLAIGFGAQNLVRDIITGFFIIFEDQFAVGDYIALDGISGTVEEMGLRITRLRDFSGQLHIVPNGKIERVTNHSRGYLQAIVDIGVAYEEDLEKVIALLRAVCSEVAALPEVKEGPEVLGIVNFAPFEMVLRIVAKTEPLAQWRVERELRRRTKELFDREGVKISCARNVLLGLGGRRAPDGASG